MNNINTKTGKFSEIPLVSVCIPTYNNARFIRATLDSVINQTYSNLEIVVVDNASTDNTQEIVESFNDKRIRYHRNPNTIHCLSNWNLCVGLAKSDFVTIYHSDDIYEPEIVEREITILLNNLSVGAVFCIDNIIDENGNFVSKGTNLPPYFNNTNIISYEELFPLMLTEFPSFIIAPTFMARKNIFKNTGYFNADNFGASTGSAGDTDLWIRISKLYNIAIINKRLIKRRVSIYQGSNQYSFERVTPANHFIVMDNFLDQHLRSNVNKFKKKFIINMSLTSL